MTDRGLFNVRVDKLLFHMEFQPEKRLHVCRPPCHLLSALGTDAGAQAFPGGKNKSVKDVFLHQEHLLTCKAHIEGGHFYTERCELVGSSLPNIPNNCF